MSDMNSIIRRYIEKVIEKGVEETLLKKNIKVKRTELFNPLNNMIIFQYYHNEDLNKVYIEFGFSGYFGYYFDREAIIYRITNYIHNNFKYDLGIYPEIVTPEDGVDERVDITPILTPYTVGYWKCLSGRYDIIEDEFKVIKDMQQFKIPDYGEEFYTKINSIIDKYEDDINLLDNKYKEDYLELLKKYNGDVTIEEFLEERIDLKHEYALSKGIITEKFNKDINDTYLEFNIDLDKKGKKKFEDFCKIVEQIHNKYKQTELSYEDKCKYIKEHREIYLNYHDTEEYEIKIKELNEKYNILPNRNKIIPEMFEEYRKEYKKFFDTDLPTIQHNVQKMFMEIVTIY